MIDFAPLAGCRYTVIGDPITHSRSPEMQNAGFAALGLGRPYGRLRVPVEELPRFVEFARKHLDGVNLTIPHKHHILKELAGISREADLCGSVNTLLIRKGELYGETTDGYGFSEAVREAFGLATEGLRAVFFGAGGAARAVVFFLAEHGAEAIRIVNRTRERAEALAEALHDAYPGVAVETAVPGDRAKVREFLAGADLAVQATSQGLHREDPPPFDLELLAGFQELACFDMIYHRTPFLERASELGHQTSGGAGMLLHQGARSLELWTGKKAPVEIMRQALAAAQQAG